MFEALVRSFPMAMGIALSPGPVLAIVMLLMTKRAKKNGPLFLLGMFLGILTVGSIIIFIPGVIANHGGISDTTGTVKILVGILLLVLIIPIWLKKRKAGGVHKTPKMFNKLDEFSGLKVFFIGLAFSAFSLKNAALSASGAAHIHTTKLVDYFGTLSGVFFFAIISTFTVIIPIVIYFISPKKAEILLRKWRDWLIKHHWDLMMVMLAVAGFLLIFVGLKIHFPGNIK